MRETTIETPTFTEPPDRHATYYNEGVVIQAENTLFKVPRSIFELNSPVLANLLSISRGGKELGLTDDAPVYLEEVNATDFERLLILIYPIITSDEYPSAAWKTGEWTSVLHLATRWDMKSIRAMAIKNLNTVALPSSKIVLGRKFDQPTWVPEGFLILCLRTEPLEEAEALELEVRDVVGIAAAREIIRAKVMNLEGGATMFSSARLGNVRARVGKYEDGMKYLGNPVVRDVVESTFGVVTEAPKSV